MNNKIEKITGIARRLLYGKKANQLELLLSASNVKVKDIKVPDGFLLRNYKEDDANDVLSIFSLSGFNGWNKDKLDRDIKGYVDNGFFVVIDKITQKVVATMAARRATLDSKYCKSGSITWLCTHPEYRGKGLGYIVGFSAVNRLLNDGYDEVFVNTDDKRLSAIKIFLKLGFKPLMYKHTMPARWSLIMEKIGARTKKNDNKLIVAWSKDEKVN